MSRFLRAYLEWLDRVDARLARSRTGAVAVVLVAAAVRVAWVLASRHDLAIRAPIMDAAYYDEWARRIADGEWSRPGAFFMGPLYPYVLGILYRLFGTDPTVARLVQALGGTLTTWVTWRIGLRLFRPTVALVAAALVALYGTLVFYEGHLLMTWLSTLLDACAVLALLRALDRPTRARAFVTGALLGASALARANVLAFAPVAAWLVARSARPTMRLRAAAFVLAGVAVAVAPATLHNVVRGHDLVLVTSNGGLNFYIGNSRASQGTFYPPPGVDFVDDATTRITIERRLGRDLKPSEVSRYWFDRALDEVRADPARWARLMGRKVLMFASGYEMPQLESFEETRARHVVLRVPFVGFWFLGVFGLLGMVMAPRRRDRTAVVAFVGVYAASIVLFFVTARYRVPIAPMVAVFAAWMLVEGAPRALVVPRRAVAVALAAVVLAAVTAPSHFAVDRAYRAYREHLHAGRRLAMLHQYRAAEAEIDSALAIFPDEAEGYIHRAIVRKDAGNRLGAIEDYQRALERDPNESSVHYDLAQTLREVNLPLEAAKEYTEAIRLDPYMIKAWNNLGITLRDAGRTADAIVAFRKVLELDPHYARGYNNLGSCLAEADSLDAALRVLEEGARRFPEYAPVHRNLAMLWAQKGNPWKAIVSIERYLALRPRDDAARAMLRKLREAADALDEGEGAPKGGPRNDATGRRTPTRRAPAP